MKYREVGWQRTSLVNGDPLAKPRMHLTEDGARTCCGIKIPHDGTETHRYRIDMLISGIDCERCFIDKRKDEIRKEDLHL